MRKIIALSINDFKNITRDKILLLMLFAPVLLLGVTRFGVTTLAHHFPEVADYYFIILAFFCLENSIIPSFIFAFIMLDEKDENLLQVYRIMPMSSNFFIGYRMLFSILIGFVFSLLQLQFSGLMEIDFLFSVALASIFSLSAPIFILFIVTFAKNKIEGVTFAKGANLIISLPFLIIFIDSYWEYAFGLIPVFWIFKIFETFKTADNTLMYLFIALILHLVYIGVLLRLFKKRIFR